MPILVWVVLHKKFLKPISCWGALVIGVSLAVAGCVDVPTKSASTPTAVLIENAQLPPSIEIILPRTERTVGIGMAVPIVVEVKHSVGIDRVALWVNGELHETARLENPMTEAEVSFTWVPDALGVYTIELMAYHGLITSESVFISVNVSPDIIPTALPPTEVRYALCQAYILSDNVRIQRGPGLDWSISGYFAKDEVVTVLGENLNPQSETWLKVRRENGWEGWLLRNSGYIRLDGDCDLMPFALAPPPEPTKFVPIPPGERTLRLGAGYGIHVAPHLDVDPVLVQRLRINWVKVYTDDEAADFKYMNVLYRLELGYPSDWLQFRQFVYSRTVYLTSLGVDAIEVHNEPNLALDWHGNPNVAEYTLMLQEAYLQIKAANPNMIVVSGGLAPTTNTPDGSAIDDLIFARQMFELGAGDYFDAFGYHPYGYNAPPEQAPSAGRLNFRRAELIREIMVEFGLGKKPIWMTEFGWLRDPAEDGVTCDDSNPDFAGFGWLKVSGQTQANYTVRAVNYADRYWGWSGPLFLWNLNWAQLPETAVPLCSHMRWFSLLDANGKTTAALEAFALSSRRRWQ